MVITFECSNLFNSLICLILSIFDTYRMQAVRDCFFDLYNEPVLETLRESLSIRYPEVEFPPVPERGNLDLEEVKESIYFFH